MKPPLVPVSTSLFNTPFDFEFFQAVRLLHVILNDRVGVGRISQPDEEPVRFKVRQSLEFQPSSIHSLSAETDPPQMTVAFLGLTGVQGVMPHHYTEYILARAEAGDFAMADFLDLFNHRILSLFYRAWEKHRLPVRFELAASKGEEDHFTHYLFDWIGMGTERLRNRLAFPDQALLRYAGLLGQKPACAMALGAILHDFFGVPVEIEEYTGAWYALAEDDQCNLNQPDLRNGLGAGAIAGDAVWDPQARFRIRLGPLRLAQFAAFLPDGDAIEKLRDLVRFYVGPILQFEVQLLLAAEEVPWSCPGDETAAGPRLGWCGWLKTEPFRNHADDAVFSL